ncbi:MAG TPA: histidinol-phosphatase HisJ family protein [bacterium]|nr:histidinol-phosphatase HisJ family protein [bacterium]
MKKLFDYHLHTCVSEDASSTLPEMAEAAAELGLSEIAITNHFIIGYEGYQVTVSQLESHREEAIKLESRLGIKILIGAEVDYFEGKEAEIERFLSSFDFDIVLGAAHFVDGYGIASESGATELLKMMDAGTAFRKSIVKATEAAATGMFDVMAHPDIMKKYTPFPDDLPAYEEYYEEAVEFAKTLNRTNTGFEINCRGFDHNAGEQYPSMDFVRTLLGEGVDTVTIGSDAHDSATVGKYLDKGLSFATQAGIREFSLFEKRKCVEKISTSEMGFDF